MIYIKLFLPSVLAVLAFLMLLKFGFSKNGLIIGLLCGMAVYLLAETRLGFVPAVNGTVLTVVLVYTILLLVHIRKKKKGN